MSVNGIQPRSLRRIAPPVREAAAAANDGRGAPNLFETPYGFGEPATVFGRVARWTMSPTSGTSQPRTTTRVRFGELRRAESFMIQMAIQSQSAIPMSMGTSAAMPQPAIRPAACASVNWVGVGLVSCARRADVESKVRAVPDKSRFMAR